MPEAAGRATLRLLTWLSPAFPVGSFSYSHGLERAVHDGLVCSAEELREWCTFLISSGSAWNDAVLLAEAYRRAGRLDGAGSRDASLRAVAELAEALAGSEERHRESLLQGAAFLSAARANWPHAALEALPEECAYCVAVGAAAGAHGIPLGSTLEAYLQAFVVNQTQAAIRLGVMGQAGAVAVMASLETLAAASAHRAAASTLDDLGSCAMAAEIAAMKHETQPTRLFRS